MMEFLTPFLAGLETITSFGGLLCLITGVALGILIGATPGLSPAMGVALLVPLSFGMDPAHAFVLFVAAYQGANYGGSITAIAINAPGTPSAVVTAIDGYALTRQGKPSLALGTAVLCSAIGGFIGAIILIGFALPIAKVALLFGPPEYFSLALLGLTTVVSFASSGRLKALAGLVLGLLLSTVGLDPFSGAPRLTMGLTSLHDGIPFIPAMIGLFGLTEIFAQLSGTDKGAPQKALSPTSFGGELPAWQDIKSLFRPLSRSSILGTLIGIVPGAGATIAAFISYGAAKGRSREPQKFGNGSLEGIAAAEGANSSSVGGALVPLLALGLPGSATDAVLLGALTLHGLTAGPELFSAEPRVVYGIFISLLLANVLILLFGFLGNRLWLQVIRIPKELLYPFIIMLCFLGSYSIANSFFHAWVCFLFGLGGWLLYRVGIKPAPIVLGLVLGQMVELNFRRTLLMGDLSLFISRPLSLALLCLAVLTLAAPLVAARKKATSGESS